VQHDPRFLAAFSGRQLLPDMEPIAMLYAGHQFGHYVRQLGDGARHPARGDPHRARRALGAAAQGQRPDPVLARRRRARGAALEHPRILAGEALHGLGIPSTRALCLVGADDEVYREQIETGAMITRVAPSHVRFGSFEVFYYREQYDRIGTLADYVIDTHYPELAGVPDRYLKFLETVIARTARLLAQWQAAGFAHGVMNTDNMSILGLTLDYGPYGFLDAYNPASSATTPTTTAATPSTASRRSGCST